MSIKIRLARKSDRVPILGFCKNTFSWGDYIEDAWDEWLEDPRGALYVSDYDNENAIGLAHVSLCPDKQNIWIEGVRVRHDYRRLNVASELIQRMIDFGIGKGASDALGIVSDANAASRRMIEKLGFLPISDWAYFGIDQRLATAKTDCRIASTDDVDHVLRYLDSSKVFALSAGRFMDSWKWYKITKLVLHAFARKDRLVVYGEPIEGLAMLNTEGYWNRKGILQVAYLDGASSKALYHLVNHVTKFYADGNFDRLQVLCHLSLAAKIPQFRLKNPEHFILYCRNIEGRSESESD